MQCFSFKFYRLTTKTQKDVILFLRPTVDIALFLSVNGKTSKKCMAHRAVSPGFSLKFYHLPTTRCENALWFYIICSVNFNIMSIFYVHIL